MSLELTLKIVQNDDDSQISFNMNGKVNPKELAYAICSGMTKLTDLWREYGVLIEKKKVIE